MEGASGLSVQGSFGFRMQHPQPNEGAQKTITASKPAAATGSATAAASATASPPGLASAPTSASNQTQQPNGAQQNQRIQTDLRPYLAKCDCDDPVSYSCRAQHANNQVLTFTFKLTHFYFNTKLLSSFA